MRVVAYGNTFNARQVIFDNITLVARLGVLLLLYTHVANLKGGTMGGMSAEMVGWTSFLYFLVYSFGNRHTARAIERDVKSGKIETYLARPMDYRWYRFFSKLGGQAMPVLGTVLGGCALLLSLFGIPYFLINLTSLFSLLVTLVLGFFLGFFVNMCIGFTAFWLEDIQPVQNFFEKAAMVLGGAYVPVALFPPWMQDIATYTPFGLAYATTRVVSPTWAYEWQTVIFAQVVWMLIAFVLMLYMYQQVLKRVTVNGG
jgi:ABC-2 type transport system permease protein